MNQVSLLQLREAADQLILLASTFQIKPHYLRAKQIRQADKSLIAVDAFFSAQLAIEARQWKESIDGLQVLKKKLTAVQEKQKEIEDLELRINALKVTTQPWFSLEENERQKIIQNAKRAQDFINNHLEKTEAHILHRYNRFSALKELSPYADNANYLCEAVFHYENREKYETNIEKVEQKNVGARERLKTVNRGFWLAVIFCIFLFTIPISFPFAISLWKRKKEIENQIVNAEETLRREHKRLVAAEEGAVVAQDIRSHLGEISLEQIRDTLAEVRDLRAEFQGPERTTSSTAILLSFIDLHKLRLVELFGEIPENPIKTFKWISDNVNKYQNTESVIKKLQEKKEEVTQQQRQMTKGYSQEMLIKSILKLERVSQSTMLFPFDNENKTFFADIAVQLPATLSQIREVLFFVSRSHPIDAQYWDMQRVKIQGFSNTMSLCVLDAEIASHMGNAVLKAQEADELKTVEAKRGSA
ncbi:hypothetical protein [Fluviispira multicolorata]|uniref:Uncharacterized protein n=1 Tax=Fluviispira multicolorata TaxID=2654512 RepID=A0A833JD95_9BACT|nr:hypothetical protein [Fluviispira multicolorata]KAB8028127.1 hypothetical protein GCL57_13845 [Fluviispira multicolorata]